MIYYLLMISAFLAAWLIFDYVKTRNIVHDKEMAKQLDSALSEITHLTERVQHLEIILTNSDSNFEPEQNSDHHEKTKNLNQSS